MKHAEEIAAAYEQGITVGAICAEYGIHPPEVYKAVRQMGVQLRGRTFIGAYKDAAEAGQVGLGGQGRPGVPRVGSALGGEGGSGSGSGDSRGSGSSGRTKMRWPQIYGQDTYAKVVAMYRNGIAGKKIAVDLGIRYNHVLAMLHDASVEIIPGRGLQKYREIKDEVIRAFRMPGVSLEDICIEFGITMDVLYRIVRFEPEVARMRDELAKARSSGSGSGARIEVIVEEVLRRFKEEVASEGGLGVKGVVAVQLPLF